MSVSSSLGIGSGMDINSMVSQLVQAEGQPALNILSKQEKTNQTKLSALGTLKSALSEFQTAVNALKSPLAFQAQTATSSNESLATATAVTGSVAGSYTLEVLQLAKPQKNIGSVGFASISSTVAAGTLNFTVNGKTPFAVTVNAGDSLSTVRDNINSSTTNNGVTASIINVDDGFGATVSKLVLTAKGSGTANSFIVSSAGASAAALGVGETPTIAAQDAKIKVDGQTASRSTNTMSDVIPGVTLNLLSAPTISTPFTLNVAQDSKSINTAASNFVNAYNKLQSTLKDLGKYDATTKAAGALNGDSTLRLAQDQIRSLASSVVSSASSTTANSLPLIGFKVDRYGVMSLDSAKFSSLMSSNLTAITDVFSSSNGIAKQMDSKLSSLLQAGGTIDTQTQTINKNLKSITDKRAAVQLRLDGLQKTMLKQFQAMDATVGQFRSTGTMLSQKFSN